MPQTVHQDSYNWCTGQERALNCVDGTWEGKCAANAVKFDQWGLAAVQYTAELHCCVPRNQSLTALSACPSLIPGKVVKFDGAKQLMCAVVYNSKKAGLSLAEQWAYIMATAQHESGTKFTLGIEGWNRLARRYTGLFLAGAYNKIDEALRLHTRYYPYVGRGFVQLTWAKNYAALQEELHCPFMAAPQLALRPDIALYALVKGMASGQYDSSKRAPCRGRWSVRLHKQQFYRQELDRGLHLGSLHCQCSRSRRGRCRLWRYVVGYHTA
jgi:hypothetical protein